jgi:hypothetical protein
VQVPQKEKAVCELLGADADDIAEHFHEFIDIAKRITDWQPANELDVENEEDEYGVAVDLEADEDEMDGEGALLSIFACCLMLDGSFIHKIVC